MLLFWLVFKPTWPVGAVIKVAYQGIFPGAFVISFESFDPSSFSNDRLHRGKDEYTSISKPIFYVCLSKLLVNILL